MSTCEAIDRFLGIDLGTCGQSPAALVRRICVHEHVREGLLCDFHVEHASSNGACRACWEGPQPHDCPITVVQAEEGIEL